MEERHNINQEEEEEEEEEQQRQQQQQQGAGGGGAPGQRAQRAAMGAGKAGARTLSATPEERVHISRVRPNHTRADAAPSAGLGAGGGGDGEGKKGGPLLVPRPYEYDETFIEHAFPPPLLAPSIT